MATKPSELTPANFEDNRNMIRIQRENVKNVLKEADQLFVEHYQEIEGGRSTAPLNLNKQRLVDMQNNNSIVVITVRKDGNIIGYSLYSLYYPLEYCKTIFANNEDIFIKKSERKGHLGLNLIRLSEEELKNLGVKKINYSVTPVVDFSPILKRAGYEINCVKYSKYFE